MKIHFNILSKLILLQSILLLSSNDLLAISSTKCNTGFMRSFGLKGIKHSQFGAVEMCAGVKNSCCTKEDQMIMYGNWIAGKQEEKITHRYKTLNTVYDSLLSQLKIVHEFAKKVEDLTRLKKFSNCKFLANRITSYRLPTIDSALRQSLAEMESFFTNAYKGVYCTLCNADNHKYIREKKVSIVLNENMCRSMTKITLSPMLYFHVHMNKYINLVTKFMLSCDFRGEYELDKVMPKELLFVSDEKIKKSLSECKLYRNTKQWLVYCKDICEQFQIGKFSHFFEPSRIKVAKYVVYIKRLIAEYIRKEKSMPLFSTNIDSGSSTDNNQDKSSQGNTKNRLLSSSTGAQSGSTDANKSQDPNADPNQQGNDVDGQGNKRPKDKMLDLIKSMEKEKDVTTFKFDTTAPVNAANFKAVYKTRGIDLVQAGEMTLFEEAIFNQVKTIVNLQRLAKTSGGSLTAEQKEMLRANSIDRFSTLVVFFIGVFLVGFK